MAHIDTTGHLHLDSPLGVTTMVLCPHSDNIEDIIVHPGDTAPSEPMCEGCYEILDIEDQTTTEEGSPA